ncbi:hypothetical protein [Streptomyces sp. C]|uniref:hypothetical protein n=1 Tax=Streptomyces sp. C TaxID=253839 RepID=UPI0001B53C17|nr:hypothetical protein [Streptomyces sp. C]EFL14153.1 predicted protein [Streptomyces sp. C]
MIGRHANAWSTHPKHLTRGHTAQLLGNTTPAQQRLHTPCDGFDVRALAEQHLLEADLGRQLPGGHPPPDRHVRPIEAVSEDAPALDRLAAYFGRV